MKNEFNRHSSGEATRPFRGWLSRQFDKATNINKDGSSDGVKPRYVPSGEAPQQPNVQHSPMQNKREPRTPELRKVFSRAAFLSRQEQDRAPQKQDKSPQAPLKPAFVKAVLKDKTRTVFQLAAKKGRSL